MTTPGSLHAAWATAKRGSPPPLAPAGLLLLPLPPPRSRSIKERSTSHSARPLPPYRPPPLPHASLLLRVDAFSSTLHLGKQKALSLLFVSTFVPLAACPCCAHLTSGTGRRYNNNQLTTSHPAPQSRGWSWSWYPSHRVASCGLPGPP